MIGDGKISLSHLRGLARNHYFFDGYDRARERSVVVRVSRAPIATADAELAARFRARARALVALDHPNLQKIVAAGLENDGLLYVAYEMPEGDSLGDLIERRLALSSEGIASIMEQTCAGLARAHLDGVVHGAVRPSNVHVLRADDGSGAFLVTVGGLALDVIEETASLADSSLQLDYASPEHCLGEILDERSDVYSCGVLLYELVTSTKPFVGYSAGHVIEGHLVKRPRPPSSRNPSVDGHIEAIILRAIAKARGERYPSARSLRADLLLAFARWDAPGPSSSERLKAAVRAMEDAADGPEGEEPARAPGRPEARGASDVAVDDATPPPSAQGRSAAEEIAKHPARWLGAFAELAHEKEFRVAASALDDALAVLVTQRNLSAVLAVHSTLDFLARYESRGFEWRKPIATELLRHFRDEGLLQSLCDAVLRVDQPAASTLRLFIALGEHAARALIAARIAAAGDATVRPRFTTGLRELGPAALPAIVEVMKELEPRCQLAATDAVLVDVLEAAPSVRHEEAGEITRTYLRPDRSTSVVASAARALAGFSGSSATGHLLELLDDGRPDVAIATVRALRSLGPLHGNIAQRVVRAMMASDSDAVRQAFRAALDS